MHQIYKAAHVWPPTEKGLIFCDYLLDTVDSSKGSSALPIGVIPSQDAPTQPYHSHAKGVICKPSELSELCIGSGSSQSP